MEETPGVQDIEIDLLLEAVHRHSGYDFKNYARPSLERRLNLIRNKLEQASFSALIPMILHDRKNMDLFLREMSVTVTQMFRNPDFFAFLRQKVLSELLAWPYIKIWCAGCATGEEVYALAILLEEEGLYDRCQIYATDFNATSLGIAQRGCYPIEKVQQFVENYNRAGGKKAFADYYRARYDSITMDARLGEKTLFTHHNLVCDGSFGEMNLILCRNVCIYFNRALQHRVFSLFDQSLCHGGFLCLGSRESMNLSRFKKQYSPVSCAQQVYKKEFTPPE